VLLPGSQPASSTTDAPGAPQCGEALLRQAWRCLPGAALLRRWKLAWYLFKHTGASTRLLISMRHMLMQSQLPPLYAPYDRFLGYRQRKRNPLSKKYLAMLAVSQPTPPHRYYVICATQRSGSTLLGELLNRSDVAGKPFELFNMRNPRFPWHWWNRPEAVERLYQHCTSFTTPNHVCGIKVLSFQWENLRARLRARPPYRGRSPEDVFDEILWHPHYIWIRRRDKLRQAISLWRALQTQAWVSHYRPRNRPVFDTGAIDWLVQQLHNEDQQWQQFFDQRGITPMTIVYEDLITDQAGTLQRVLDYLDLPLSAASTVQNTTVQRQADAITEEWLLMYYDHRQYCTH
jgi:LPS sulfotransferase NodH